MKKPASKKVTRTRAAADDEIRPEYDFSRGGRNVYADRFQAGATVVVLDADVAESFPDAGAVNEALRALAKIAKRPANKPRSKRRTA